MTAVEPVPLLASLGPLELAVPECPAGIGDIILATNSPKLIEGVLLEPFAIWPDDRGYFLEVQRLGQGLSEEFPPASTQVSAALSDPATIKAFHFHLHQTDCWVPVQGMFQFALVDFRIGSPTFGRKNTLYCGSLRPLASADSAGDRAWLQGRGKRSGHAGLPDQPPLRSRGRRAGGLQQPADPVRLGITA